MHQKVMVIFQLRKFNLKDSNNTIDCLVWWAFPWPLPAPNTIDFNPPISVTLPCFYMLQFLQTLHLLHPLDCWPKSHLLNSRDPSIVFQCAQKLKKKEKKKKKKSKLVFGFNPNPIDPAQPQPKYGLI